MRIMAALDNYGAADSRNRRRMRALVLLLRHSGLRISDAVTLSSERINDDKLFLYTSKAGTPVSCPLPPFVIIALEAAIDANERFYFWTGNGKVKTIISDWQAKLKTLFEKANVATGYAHRFRDAFATELLLAGSAAGARVYSAGPFLDPRHGAALFALGTRQAGAVGARRPRHMAGCRIAGGGYIPGTRRKQSPQLIPSTLVSMAEGEGFEPPVPFRVHRFSRPTVSTAHTSLRG